MRNFAAALLAAAACSSSDQRAERLGIAAVRSWSEGTTQLLVALDATGAEVGRVVLTRDAFVLSPPFRDRGDADVTVEGRRLSVSLRGKPALHFETPGFEPLLELPAHPAGNEELGAFLQNPAVRDLLASQQLGFAAAAPRAESAFTVGHEEGEFRADCAGQARCGEAVQGIVPSSCGTGALPSSAIRIKMAGADADAIGQCCPPINFDGIPATFTNWFAVKQCPWSGKKTPCGSKTGGGGCAGCPIYPVPATEFCQVGYAGRMEFCYSDSAAGPIVLEEAQGPAYWPPDGRRVTVDLASCLRSASDACVAGLSPEGVVSSPGFKIDAVGANEPIEQGDIVVESPRTVSFRVARNGGGTGREYFVRATYQDRIGAKASFECHFSVSSSQRAP